MVTGFAGRFHRVVGQNLPVRGVHVRPAGERHEHWYHDRQRH